VNNGHEKISTSAPNGGTTPDDVLIPPQTRSTKNQKILKRKEGWPHE
jgi:hypothetical protein